ncbi:MAG: hypothetical protein KDA31_12220 [Phycisphaerales bacterium]|nr:hypothetical protein [Phycisphaerales bacterium]
MPTHLITAILLTVTLMGCASRPPAPDLPTVTPALGEWHEGEIEAYERADAQAMPDKGQVLFIGSSSVRMWKTLAEDMAPAPVINRGFGGSKTPEVLAVVDRIVFPYEPSVIVYYCGDNDLGTDNTDAESAVAGFIQFAELVHERLPKTKILYMSIKPSVARWSNWEAMTRANVLVARYCGRHEHAYYMDLATPLLKNGEPDPSLFKEDGLHLNAVGYARWTKVVQPLVLEAFRESYTGELPF